MKHHQAPDNMIRMSVITVYLTVNNGVKYSLAASPSVHKSPHQEQMHVLINDQSHHLFRFLGDGSRPLSAHRQQSLWLGEVLLSQ